MSEKRHLGWEDVESYVKVLIDQIKESGKEYNCILGLANGGLVPTCLMAKALVITIITISLVVLSIQLYFLLKQVRGQIQSTQEYFLPILLKHPIQILG